MPGPLRYILLRLFRAFTLMPHCSHLIPSGPDFWASAARALCNPMLLAGAGPEVRDMSMLHVLVPGSAHIQPLQRALSALKPATYLPPRISTLSSWLALHAPPRAVSSDSTRMMALYAELRQHGWLKKLFAARRNTDLLPLAQTLIALFDELSTALLPQLSFEPAAAEARWAAALEQLSPSARDLLSEEAQLVWTLWKSQLDANDPAVVRLESLHSLARAAKGPLVWVGMHEPDALQQAFLSAYAERQHVLTILPDWQPLAVPGLFAAAWPEVLDGETIPAMEEVPCALSLYRAGGLEDEAITGAQTVLDWLREGHASIAIIAQDRLVARRMRALLERAQVGVADETGWKLSTTRAAAALVALLEVAVTGGGTLALLDLLKSPFVLAANAERLQDVMEIEQALRRANVSGGWNRLFDAVQGHSERTLLETVAAECALLAGRKTLANWSDITLRALDRLGMRDPLQQDHAGQQVVSLLDMLALDHDALTHAFSFAEWRAFLSLQLESTPFLPAASDRRVVMLQLAGAPLRHFDAVLMVGADADHLPSQPRETLFFASSVRRELGLATRETLQRSQLREFTELLAANPRVVLSWQAQRNGEPNVASPWLQRLELARAYAGLPPLPAHRRTRNRRTLRHNPPDAPAPAAAHLLPAALSASAYNSLVACPYQFFATRMLGLNGLDELSDMPEKHDYGEWLHAILNRYHETLRDQNTPLEQREHLLRGISEQVFEKALAQSGAALAWYARWQKVMPAYLDWANAREAQGWRFMEGEAWLERRLEWEGGQIVLRGRVDRIDENAEGERAVLDYKTRTATSLRTRLKEGEDQQLAFYGLLCDKPVAHGHYVALEASNGKTGEANAEDFEAWQQAVRVQLQDALSAITKGAALPANGVQRVCNYCDVRGLCRKGEW